MSQAPKEQSQSDQGLKYLQRLNNYVDSFKNALKSQDLWEATDIATKLSYYTNTKKGVKDIMNTGVLKYIVKLVDPRYYSRERLMIQCSSILCNMTCGEEDCVKYIVDLGVIKRGLQLLKHPNHEVKSNAAWLLSNISGGDLKYRDMVLNEGVVKQVEWVLKTCAPRPPLMKHVTWLLSNLVRGKPYPPFSQIQGLLKYIGYFLHNSKNTEVLTHLLWCLSYVTDGDDDQIQLVYDLDICSKLISFVKKDNPRLQAPALRTIGNMLTISNDEVNLFIQNGIIEVYSDVLHQEIKSFRKEASWGLSNIMADDPALVSQVLEFENGKIIKRLVEMCSVEDQKVINLCLYCFTNACSIASIRELAELVELGVTDVLVSNLNSNLKTKDLVACLEALLAILDALDTDPNYDKHRVLARISDDGWAKIEKLQAHPDNEVYNIAVRLIELHFDDE